MLCVTASDFRAVDSQRKIAEPQRSPAKSSSRSSASLGSHDSNQMWMAALRQILLPWETPEVRGLNLLEILPECSLQWAVKATKLSWAIYRLSSSGKMKKHSETREWGFQKINSVSELRKKEVVGNAWCSLRENMFVAGAVNDSAIALPTWPASDLLSLPTLLWLCALHPVEGKAVTR